LFEEFEEFEGQLSGHANETLKLETLKLETQIPNP